MTAKEREAIYRTALEQLKAEQIARREYWIALIGTSAQAA